MHSDGGAGSARVVGASAHAQPMQVKSGIEGGAQFPPVEALPDQIAVPTSDAMERLANRVAASGEAGSLKAEGFEASVHKIKEQVLPRLLERIDPEAASPRFPRTSWPRNSARSSARCSPSSRSTLNRREQYALEKVLVDELLGLGPLEELLSAIR